MAKRERAEVVRTQTQTFVDITGNIKQKTRTKKSVKKHILFGSIANASCTMHTNITFPPNCPVNQNITYILHKLDGCLRQTRAFAADYE